MIAYYKTLSKQDRLFFWLSCGVILIGIILRLAYWFHNRDLIIDEANIARNLFEKDYGQLTGRLNYEQYAPVLFLWIEKTFTLFFGFSEQALRAYPLFCSIGALFVFMMVLKEFVSIRVIWYPLFYLAAAHFFSRYATEVKQYSSDLLIALLLVWLALKSDILTRKTTFFFFTWLAAGTVAVWASMPSVFMLLGVSMYYFVVCLKAKKISRFFPFVIAGVLCAAQFAGYYFAVLKQDAHSQYLQAFHEPYFLTFSSSLKAWKQNYYIISDIPKIATGILKFGIILNMPLLLIGTIAIIKRYPAKALLVIVPLAATIVAAFLREFSLIPRVCLFMMPLFMILIGIGLDTIFNLRIKLLTGVVTLACLWAASEHEDFRRIAVPFYSEQVTDGMRMMVDNNIRSKKLHISHGSYPAYLYYTTIHPNKQQWFPIFDAIPEKWDADWGGVSSWQTGRFGVIFSTIDQRTVRMVKKKMQLHSRIVYVMEKPEAKSYAYILDRNPGN